VRERLSRNLRIPEFLTTTIVKLPSRYRQLGVPPKSVLSTIEGAISDQLQSIAQSTDSVSVAPRPLLTAAVPPSEAELIAARLRKELGNPPGKPSDPLGDQLTWEQLLTHVQPTDELWIVTRDLDYFIKDRENCL